jgi:hypothetical protein
MNKVTESLLLVLLETWEFVKTIRKYWYGGLFLILCVLVTFWYKADPLPFFRSLSSDVYTHGILTFAFVAWALGFWVFVLTRKEYELLPKTQNEKAIKIVGNRNWVSALFGVFATLIFWLLHIPILALIIIGVFQFISFGLGERFQQQAEYVLPKFVNLALMFLGAWIVGA